MKFISKYTIRPEHRNDAIKRFLEGKAQPPGGVKLIGRWHSPNDRTGYSLLEADDAVAMGKYSHQWSDLRWFVLEGRKPAAFRRPSARRTRRVGEGADHYDQP